MSILVAILTLVCSAWCSSCSVRHQRRSRARRCSGRASRGATVALSRCGPERDELEAAREAKYREIRDAELDYRTGKLSSEDYEAIDGALRAEAVEILNRLGR